MHKNAELSDVTELPVTYEHNDLASSAMVIVNLCYIKYSFIL